jgi:F0F1-type ATP synthase membrane subunit a
MRKAILGLLAVAALPSTALAAEGHGFSWFMIFPGGERYYYVYAALFIAAFLLVAAAVVVGGKKTEEMVVPDPRFTLRNLFELILGFLAQLAEDIIGHHYKKYLPLLGTSSCS